MHHEFIKDYRTHFAPNRRMAYINFNKITNIKSLAECFLEQYVLLFGSSPKYYGPSNELDFLYFSVQLFSESDDEEYTFIWLDNFTEVRHWEKADYVLEILRGIFQHQQNVVHIFTSCDIGEVANIFSNYDNPFYHFAVQIKIGE